jgi:hypothetical protein
MKNIKFKKLCVFTITIVLVLVLNITNGLGNYEIKNNFEKNFQLWKEYCEEVSYSSRTSDRLESQYFKNIIAMGPGVLPYLIEKREQDPNFNWSGWIWTYLSRVNTDTNLNPWAKEPIEDWWKGGRAQSIQRFDNMYKNWKEYKTKKASVDAEKSYKTIKSLGIAVLPEMIKKIEGGEIEFISSVSQLTDNQIKEDANAFECLEWWQKNKEDWLIPFPNKQPKAKAGQDKTVSSGQNVQLDGSASSDEDKDELTYQWKQISGPEVKLSDANAVKPSFTAPKVDKETEFVFELKVNDGSRIKQVHPSCESGQSQPSTVKIIIKP